MRKLAVTTSGLLMLTMVCWSTQRAGAAGIEGSIWRSGSVARVAETLSQTPGPCKERPENRQFEFWVGDWDVKRAAAEAGPSVGASRIESFAGGCIILENWESPGFTGKSWNFFDVGSGKWRQIWLDVTGRKAEFSGEYKDGAMRFDGETITAKGQKVKSHMTFFNLGPNKVRQFAERSTDDGKSWTTTVDLIYLRKH